MEPWEKELLEHRNWQAKGRGFSSFHTLQPGRGRRKNLQRFIIALAILFLAVAVQQNQSSFAREVKGALRYVLTTEVNYQPLVQRVVQMGLQTANVDWPMFTEWQGRKIVETFSPQRETAGVSTTTMPVSGKITRTYGWIKDEDSGLERFSEGIDIAAPSGTPVKAVQDGQVVKVGKNAVLGNYLVIVDDKENSTLYGYCREVLVHEQQRVHAGDVIAKVGHSGAAREDSLHFEVREKGKLVDPLRRLESDANW